MSPLAWHAPAMRQCPETSSWAHWPALHTSPVQVSESLAQAVPSVLLLNPEEEAAASQTWHSLAGFW